MVVQQGTVELCVGHCLHDGVDVGLFGRVVAEHGAQLSLPDDGADVGDQRPFGDVASRCIGQFTRQFAVLFEHQRANNGFGQMRHNSVRQRLVGQHNCANCGRFGCFDLHDGECGRQCAIGRDQLSRIRVDLAGDELPSAAVVAVQVERF